MPVMRRNAKKNWFLILGMILGSLGGSVLTFTPLCQAKSAYSQSHPCCRSQNSCPAQYSQKRCCGASSSLPDSKSAVFKSSSFDGFKIYPALLRVFGLVAGDPGFLQAAFILRSLSFASPPLFLNSHSLLC
jgi:hypothetical protein